MEEYFLGLGDEFSADNTLYGGLFKSYTFPSPKLPSDLKPAPTNILLVTFPTVFYVVIQIFFTLLCSCIAI